MTKLNKQGKRDKRGNGEGSIKAVRTLPTGENVYRWEIWVTYRTGERKRLRGTHTGRSIQQARKEMQEAKQQAESGQRPHLEKALTVAALLDEWLKTHRQAQGVSARTLQIQAGLIRNHILPRMGKWKVAALDAAMLTDFHFKLMAETTVDRTRFQVHGVLNQFLDYAVIKNHLVANPIKSVRVPRRVEQRQARRDQAIKAWSPQEARRLERAAMETRSVLGYAIVFGLHTGLRRGEVFGLQWRHINLTAGTLRVEEVLSTHGEKSRSITEPKTGASRRTLVLNAKTRELLRLLRELQAELPNPPEYVFVTRRGEMQHPNNANRKLKGLVLQLGLPQYPYHALRHTFCSIAAHQGVDIRTVSSHLGHANTVVTQQVYTHLWPEHREVIELQLD